MYLVVFHILLTGVVLNKSAAGNHCRERSAWVPLFKVAHGQSLSPAKGVYDLWTRTHTMNENDANALSFKPGTRTYKSAMVDNWKKHPMKKVRVSFYKKGVEKAFVVFDAQNSNKNNWFDRKRILYSSFKDLSKMSRTNFCGIAGDPRYKRRFYLNKNYGGCEKDFGWFTVVESHACCWEAKTTRPYFLYSDATVAELAINMVVADVFAISAMLDHCTPNPCQNGARCVDHGDSFECANEWVPVFKVAHGKSVFPAKSVYGLWTGTYTLREHDANALSMKAHTDTFKSSIVDTWKKHNIKQVRVSFYSNGKEKAFVVFDATGSDKNSWFNCRKIKYSSYTDLLTSSKNFCSVVGDPRFDRRFYLNKNYGGCHKDCGWFVLVQGRHCLWERKTTHPYFLYSDKTKSKLADHMMVAEVFVISVLV